MAVQACEECVQCYNTIARARQNRQVPTNPANVARAINDLMVALRPFASGAVDLETMDVIATALGLPTDDHTAHPAAVTTCLAKLKHALAVQERAVRGRRVRDEAHRDLMVLCGYIGFCLQNLYETNSASMKDTMQARFLDRLLTFAGIPHPNAFDNPKRLITLLHS